MAEYAQQKTRSTPRRFMRAMYPSAILALLSGFSALALALHYPLAPVAMTAFVLVCGAVFFTWPHLWLLVLPATLPVVGLAPWTGWITFEELDILILSAAAAGYARTAWRWQTGSLIEAIGQHRQGRLVLMWSLLGLFALSTAASMFRGFSDAGGFTFGWFQGYLEPMNSVRLAKSFFEVLLLYPLWREAVRNNPERAHQLLSQGLMLGLGLAALTTVWERSAFPGLLDFSSDYRTTGMFWEMHVGGAALDGFLALTVPFALRELLVARTPVRWGLAATVLALAAYACLTTFSRGVYLAIPVGAVVFVGLHAWQRKQPTVFTAAHPARTGIALLLPAVLTVAGFGSGAAWMFQTSGYRGMAALLALVALMLPLSRVLRGFQLSQWLLGLAAGVTLALLAAVMAWLVPKGAYLALASAVVFTALMLGLLRKTTSSSSLAGPMAFAGFLAVAAGTVLVAYRWGEKSGLQHAAPVVLGVVMLCIAAGATRKPLWPDALHWQASTAGAMGVVLVIIGIFGGGSYMSNRFTTGGRDFDVRLAHWQLGRDMQRSGADAWLGKGLGRFAANYSLTGNPQEHPGDYRLNHEGGNAYLTVTGGLHVNGWGEIFRVTQRIAEPAVPVVFTARARTEKDVDLHFEVCEKHLLYNQNCVTRQMVIKGAPGVWQSVRVGLQGDTPTRGSWYAPRLLAFSMAMESRGGLVDLDDVALTGALGRQLLSNGDFSEGMAHWFFSSDRYHMPWHIKSMFMHVLFDQGFLGATLWGLLLTGALWRTGLGTARRHPLAPALAASLTGFAVVGLFDSLLDVPRLAWLFYLLLLVAVTLRGPPGQLVTLRGARAVAGLAMAVVGCWVGLAPGTARATEAEPAPQVIRVGADKAVKTIAEAALLAKADAIIEVDAGDYTGDVAVWTQERLTLRAVGGRVRLNAAGAAAEEKAIWVMRGGQMSVEGFDFVGARVPSQNGAGIRFERGNLRVRNCTFNDNENGILTGNRPDAELTIENSEFGHNGHGDGQSHNLYVGEIARLTVTGSYFHHARVGHLLKTRAAVNLIAYNRLTDEAGGRASYELEFAIGGIAYVVGNIIQQGSQTENPHLVSYGAEGYKWPKNELYLVNNTLVDNRPQGGVLLRVKPGDVLVKAFNNLLVGPGKLEAAGPGDYRNNFTLDRNEFELAAREDYRLKRGSSVVGKMVDPGSANGFKLQPQAEYVHPRNTRELVGNLHNPGALQSMRPSSRP